MDKDAEIQKLIDERGFVQAWSEHPITVAVFQDLKEQQEAAIVLVCNEPIKNLQSFFAHFEAVGHLRGLRRVQAITQDRLDEIDQQLKELV